MVQNEFQNDACQTFYTSSEFNFPFNSNQNMKNYQRIDNNYINGEYVSSIFFLNFYLEALIEFIIFFKGYHNNREAGLETKYTLNYSDSTLFSDFNNGCNQQCVEFSNGVYYQVSERF